MSEQMSWHEKGRYVQQRMITHNGLTLCLSQWAQRLGMDASNLQKRLKTWKDQDFALTAPKGTKGKRRGSALGA